MKKIFFSLFILISSYTLFAQDADDTTGKMKVKTKTNSDGTTKTKIKSSDGTDMGDMKTKTKMKDDGTEKIKMKSDDGSMDDNGKKKMKMKSKSDNSDDMKSGTMSNSGMGTGTMTTTTTIVSIGGWTTNPANLPVIGTNVSADVVANIKNKYGATVYDIKQIKSSSGQDIYLVRIMDNGGLRSDYVGADGNTVSQ
ncbi:MAG: hypothetical protein M3004_02375 [Bacteroidota bacterium]|nr:hypothetical protein [Bacteroidota bacterium]